MFRGVKLRQRADEHSPPPCFHAACRGKRYEEAGITLSTALRFGLSDPSLLKELSQRLQMALQSASEEGSASASSLQQLLLAALQAQAKLGVIDFATRLLLAQVDGAISGEKELHQHHIMA